MRRLRVRLEGREVELPSFAWAADCDPLDAQTMETIASGTSMRRYARTLSPLPDDVDDRNVSRSAVSRRFIAMSAAKMREYLSRSLEDLGIRVVFIDAKVIHEHCMLIALGVGEDGRKHVLGVHEGATENATVAKELLERSQSI